MITNNVKKNELLEAVEGIFLPKDDAFPTHFIHYRTKELMPVPKVFTRHYPPSMKMEESDHLAVASGILNRYEDPNESWRISYTDKDYWGNKVAPHFAEILSGIKFEDVDVAFLDLMMSTGGKNLHTSISRYANGPGKDRWEGGVMNKIQRKSKVTEIGWMYTNLNTYLAYQARMDNHAIDTDSNDEQAEDNFYEGANFLSSMEGTYVDHDPSPWSTVQSMIESPDELKFLVETQWMLPSRNGTPHEWKPANEMILTLIKKCESEHKDFKDRPNDVMKPSISYEFKKSSRNAEVYTTIKRSLPSHDKDGNLNGRIEWDSVEKVAGGYSRSHTVFYIHESILVGSLPMNDPRLSKGVKDNKTPYKVVCETFNLDDTREDLYFQRKLLDGKMSACVYQYKVVGELCRLPGRAIPNILKKSRKKVSRKILLNAEAECQEAVITQYVEGNILPKFTEDTRTANVYWNETTKKVVETSSEKKLYKRLYLPEITEEYTYIKDTCNMEGVEYLLSDNCGKHIVSKVVSVTTKKTEYVKRKAVETQKEIKVLGMDFVDNVVWIPTLSAITRLRTIYQALHESGLYPLEAKGIELEHFSKEDCATSVRNVIEKIISSIPNYAADNDPLCGILKSIKVMVKCIEDKLNELLKFNEEERSPYTCPYNERLDEDKLEIAFDELKDEDHKVLREVILECVSTFKKRSYRLPGKIRLL